jgi:hypothetical protein
VTTYASTLSTPMHTSVTTVAARGRTLIIAATLALAAAAIGIVLLFRPWPVRNSFLYQELAPVRDAIWTAILVDGLAFAAIGLSLSLAVSLLARDRGARLANVGAIVTIVGAILFAMGAFAFASLTWYATDAAALPVAEGARLLEYAVANPEHVMLPQLIGFLLYTLGTLILAVALLRSGAVPRWLPLAIIGTTVAQFAVHDRALDFVQIGAMAVLILLAVRLARSSTAAR